MTRNLILRLAKLEQRQPAAVRRWHRIIVEAEADLNALAAALRASPKWSEGDGVIHRLIMDLGRRADA